MTGYEHLRNAIARRDPAALHTLAKQAGDARLPHAAGRHFGAAEQKGSVACPRLIQREAAECCWFADFWLTAVESQAPYGRRSSAQAILALG